MKLFKRICTCIMTFLIALSTIPFSTSCKNIDKQSENTSLISNEMGGGGTPSIDEPDKTYPQPVKTDVIIPDDQKVNWNDKFFEQCVEDVIVDSEDENYRGNELPSGYTQIEYLESSGKQYIDTGVLCKASGTLEYETELQYTRTSGRQIMGYDWPGGFEVDASGQWKHFNEPYSTDKYDYYTLYINFDTSETRYTLNTTIEANGTISSINPSRGNIKLFALGPYNSYFCYCKMKSFKISVDGVLTRDFIPCYDSNHVFGLYDVVGGQFYTNQGSGSFNVSYPLQGAGSQADPYQISSAMDLAYFSYSQNASNKYLKLMKDIVLNDGTFEVDENYNIIYHDGGDGKLYEWTPIQNANSGAFLDGNGHSIKGLYINDASVEYGGLFYENGQSNNQMHVGFKDLTMEDVYVHATYAYSLSHSIRDHMTNVIVKSGYLIGEKKANGFCFYRIYNGMENCENHANIVKVGSAAGPSWDGSSGFSKDFTGKVINCRNYGNIHLVANGGMCGGLFANMVYGQVCENCENHGNITGKCDRAGGYTSSPGGTTAHITNFTNYGNINAGSGAGIFVVMTDGTVIVENCKNFGEINGSGLIGCGQTRPFSLILRNCTNYGDVTTSGMIGNISYSAKANVLIDNCVNKGVTKAGFYGPTAGFIALININNSQASITISNCRNEGKIGKDAGRCRGGFVGQILGSGTSVTLISCVNESSILGNANSVGGMIGTVDNTGNKITITKCVNNGNIQNGGGIFGTGGGNGVMISNCVNTGEIAGNGISYGYSIITNCLNLGKITSNTQEIAPTSAIIKNCISDCLYKGERKKSYWGDDFSAFFVKWKTGYIGLKALESAGVYMFAIPDDEYLQQIGYTKMG